jgi:hypothetical protein
MLHLIEAIIGIALIYFGFSKFGPASPKAGVLYGLIAIFGLVLMLHGILLFLVPGFFSASM